MGSRTRRAVPALLIIAAVMAGAGRSDAGPEGASSSNFNVDVVVRGTPPPGAEIVIRAPNNAVEEYPFPLDEADGAPDVIVVAGTIDRILYVHPDEDAGAGRVTYACTMTGGPMTEPFSTCAGSGPDLHHDGGHVHASFQGNANAYAETTISLTFGRCDGRAPTVLLGDGDSPTPGDDVILGTPAPETVDGLGGHDRICGLGGGDTLRGGAGRDRLLGGGGPDRLEGGGAADALFGSSGVDRLLGQGGNDRLDGGAQLDRCDGGPQRDTAVRCETRASIP